MGARCGRCVFSLVRFVVPGTVNFLGIYKDGFCCGVIILYRYPEDYPVCVSAYGLVNGIVQLF